DYGSKNEKSALAISRKKMYLSYFNLKNWGKLWSGNKKAPRILTLSASGIRLRMQDSNLRPVDSCEPVGKNWENFPLVSIRLFVISEYFD
ncbi:MAG: hypothetical protein K940chlam6_00547, partial [Chlamydiae bacterium]|nr:hypothetical protein [Chlamydiota bacterium]